MCRRPATTRGVGASRLGALRIRAELQAEGITVSRKRVARLMRGAGLVGVCRRKGTVTTRRDANSRPVPDLVERNFTADQPDQPDQLWIADITYPPTWAGFLYLAVVLDAYSRRIVGWAMADHLKSQLVLDALNMALGQRHSPFQPRQPIHLSGLRAPLPRGWRSPIHGLGRECLRQRHVRELLRDARMRTARPTQVPVPCRGAHRRRHLHRRMVQSPPTAFRPRLSVTDRIRKETRRLGVIQAPARPPRRGNSTSSHTRIYICLTDATCPIADRVPGRGV